MTMRKRNKSRRIARIRKGREGDVRSVGQSDQESLSVDGGSSACCSDDVPMLGEAIQENEDKADFHLSFDGAMKNASHPVWNSNAPEFKPKILSLENMRDKPAADVLIHLNLQEMENKGKSMPGNRADDSWSHNENALKNNGSEFNTMSQLLIDRSSRILKNKPGISVNLQLREKLLENRVQKAVSSEQLVIPRSKIVSISYTEKRDQKELTAICPEYKADVIRQKETRVSVVIPRGIQKKSAETSYLDSLEAVAFFINPLARNEIKIDLLGMLDKILAKRPDSPNSGFCDKENKAVQEITQAVTKLWKMLSTIKYANLGFAAENELQADFPYTLLENNYDWEADTLALTNLVEKLIACPLPTDALKSEFDKANKDSQEILDLIMKDDRVKLSEMNIQHKGTAQIRILHGLEVTDSELFEVVQLSVATDYGNFLWMVEHQPDLLLHSLDIADAVVSSIHRKMLSKDLRPLAALVWIVPKMLQSLTPKELCILSEKYVSNQEVKIGNWPEVLLFGYQMRWLKKNCGQLQLKCIIEAALADATPVEEITSFLLFCALIAEFGEGRFARVYDFSTDSFCTRIGRVLASNIPIENKNKLINSLMALPDPVKQLLLADGNEKTSTSLYYSAEVIIMLQVEASAKVKALELLGEHISLVRVVNVSILPNFTGQKRMLVGPILSSLVKLEIFREQVARSENGTTLLKDVAKLALEQYVDPTNGKTPRYPFMKDLLNFVDDIVRLHEANSELATTIKDLILSRNLPWYQNVALIAVCFPKSRKRVSPPRPFIEDTREDMEAIIRILQSWPEEEEVVKSAFESTVMDIRSHVDPVLFAYSLMSACVAEDSRVKDLEQYMAKFVQSSLVWSQKKPRMRQAETEEIPMWFKENILVDNADIKASVKEAVIAVAKRWKPYSKPYPTSPRTAAKPLKNRKK